jgi:hypothetical protein
MGRVNGRGIEAVIASFLTERILEIERSDDRRWRTQQFARNARVDRPAAFRNCGQLLGLLATLRVDFEKVWDFEPDFFHSARTGMFILRSTNAHAKIDNATKMFFHDFMMRFDSSALYLGSSRCASAYAKAAVRQAGGRKSEVGSPAFAKATARQAVVGGQRSGERFCAGYRLIVLSYWEE